MHPPESGDAQKSPAWPLGPLEEHVLRIVWRRGPVTVRQVLDELAPAPHVAHTTVMTIMSRLAEKSLLLRQTTGSSYLSTAASSEAEYGARVSRRSTRDLVVRFGDLALARFAAELRGEAPERLRQLAHDAELDQDGGI